MNLLLLKTAIAEAERFLARAKPIVKSIEAEALDRKRMTAGEIRTWDVRYVSPKDTGAVRRASMDLTRALADLRRP